MARYGLLVSLFAVGCAQKIERRAQQPPPPEVISKVTSARKVFLRNASGANTYGAYSLVGGVDAGYNALSTSLKQWGYFQLVASPSQADLIFEIGSLRSCSIEGMTNKVTERNSTEFCSDPTLDLAIFVPRKRMPIYVIVTPVKERLSTKARQEALAKSIEALTDQIKALVVEPAPIERP